MTTKTKIFAIVGLLAAGVAVILLPWSGVPPAPEPAGALGPAAPSVARGRQHASPDPVVAAARERIVEPAPAPPSEAAVTGALVVRVLYQGEPVPDVGVYVLEDQAVDRQYGTMLAHTDAEGRATFDALGAGRCRVWTNRFRMGTPYHWPTIVAGERARLDVVLEPGIDIEGVVVDPDGVAVAGASVYLAPLARAGFDADAVTATDARGAFRIRGCEPMCTVGARAPRYTQAPMRLVQASPDATVSVRLELGPGGGAVAGRVRDRRGEPMAGAVVRVGGGRLDGLLGTLHGVSVPAQTRTDEHGAFTVIGIAPGEHPVSVRAPGYGIWTGTRMVDAHATVQVDVTLLPGVACVGTVTAADGSPAAGARVHVGDQRTLAYFSTVVDDDGRYRLEGLPPGRLTLLASLSRRGKASARLHGASGETLRWDPRLSMGTRLVGRVLTEAGEPVEDVDVSAQDGGRWAGLARTEPDGTFVIANCPEGARLDVQVLHEGFESSSVADVDPRAGEVLLRVRPAAAPSATIIATVLGPDGEPCPGVSAWALGLQNSGFVPCDPETGRVEVGPLRPGKYRLCVRSPDHPPARTEPVVLAAHQTWDAGVVRLVEGGRVRVELAGHRAGRIHLLVRDMAGEHVAWIPDAERRNLSEPLVPGRYRLWVWGPEVVPDVLPLEVRAGRTATLTVVLARGLRRRIDVEVPAAQDRAPSVAITVRAFTGEAVVQTSFLAREGRTASVTSGFAPGRYTVTATCEERAGSARFRVDAGSVDAEPIRLVIE